MSPSRRTSIVKLALLLVLIQPATGNTAEITCRQASASPHKLKTAVDKLGLRFLDQLQSPTVLAWVKEQAQKVIRLIRTNPDGTPNKMFSDVVARMKELNSTNPPLTVTTKEGDFFLRGGELIFKSTTGEERVLAAKITLPENQGMKVVGDFKLSPDEKKVAVAYVENNKDINDWQVLDLTSGNLYSRVMTVRLGDFAWSSNSQSVFYTHWPTRDEIKSQNFRKTNYRWSLGAENVERVFTAPQPNAREFYNIAEFVDSKGETRLLAHRNQGAADVPLALYIGRKGVARTELGEFQVDAYAWSTIRHAHRNRLGKFVGIDGDRILFRTSEVGNKFGLMEVNVLNPYGSRTLVKEDPFLTLIYAQKFSSKIVAHYFDGRSLDNYVQIFDLSGKKLKRVNLASFGILGKGMISPFVGAELGTTVDFNFSTIVNPHETFRINLETVEIKKLPSKIVDFDPQNISTKVVHIKSRDGTLVPTEIYYRKDLSVDGQLPTNFVEFYYGFIGIANSGQWNKKLQVMLDAGVGVAVVHPRGGGEKGLDWQMAGKNRRMGAAEDVVAVAEWLKRKHKVKNIAVGGRSFGGLLTMILITNYPGLFQAYIPSYGVSDVVEFSNEGTFGHAANDDWGVHRTRKGHEVLDAQFQKLLDSFSALQKTQDLADIKDIGYILLNSGDKDERVDPEQTYYFVYQMQKLLPHLSDKILMFEHTNAGHNAPRAEGPDELTVVLDKAFGIKEINKPNRRQK